MKAERVIFFILSNGKLRNICNGGNKLLFYRVELDQDKEK